MASEFASLLARFVEVYRYCPDDLKRLLNDKEMWSEYLDHRKKGDRDAENQLSSRALFELRPEQNAELLDGFESIPSGELGDDFYRQVFENADLDSLADSLGLSREDVIPYMVTQIKIQRGHDTERPDFHSAVTLDFATRVDAIVERFSHLENLGLSGLPANRRELLKESHRCYLYGLEAATAITCGAVLEDSLREIIPNSDGLKFDQLLETARKSQVFSWEEWGSGDDIREFRNLAVHDPEEFYRRLQAQKSDLLGNTRKLIEILLQKRDTV